MNKLMINEVEILRSHNQAVLNNTANGTVFTDSDLEELFAGNASFRCANNAEKVLKEVKSFSMAAMPRSEVYAVFQGVHAQISQLEARIGALVAAVDALVEKGVITVEDILHALHVIQAKGWPHKCTDCQHEIASCPKTDAKFSLDVYKDLTGELADKVISCSAWVPIAAADNGE